MQKTRHFKAEVQLPILATLTKKMHILIYIGILVDPMAAWPTESSMPSYDWLSWEAKAGQFTTQFLLQCGIFFWIFPNKSSTTSHIFHLSFRAAVWYYICSILFSDHRSNLHQSHSNQYKAGHTHGVMKAIVLGCWIKWRLSECPAFHSQIG